IFRLKGSFDWLATSRAYRSEPSAHAHENKMRARCLVFERLARSVIGAIVRHGRRRRGKFDCIITDEVATGEDILVIYLVEVRGQRHVAYELQPVRKFRVCICGS